MKKSWEEKREKVESLTKSMDEAIEQYFETPEQLKEYLSFMSRFYQYSPHNVSLINEQFQGAKAVGSFKFWKEKGYSVKKGERGIEVLVPNKTVPKFKDVNGKWKSIKYATKEEKEKIQNGELEQRKGKLYFSVGHVFDISQTTAKASDLPKIFPNRWMEGNVDDYDAMIKALHKVAKKVDVTVGRPIGELGAAKGAFYYAVEKEGNGHIGLNPRNSELQNVKTLIHELAHAKLHHMKHENHHKLNDAEKEFQAEMTAYTVASYFGIDTSDYSLSYLANWTKGKEMKDKSTLLKEVHETSVEFIETMEEILVKERKKEEKEGEEYAKNGFEEWKEKNPQYQKMTREQLLPIVAKAQQDTWERTGRAKPIEEHLRLCKNLKKDWMLQKIYSRDIHLGQKLENKKLEFVFKKGVKKMDTKQILDAHYQDCLKFWEKEKEKGIKSELTASQLALNDVRSVTTDPYSPKGEPLDMKEKDLWIEQKKEELRKKDSKIIFKQEKEDGLHWYEMTSRPISPGAQPKGFVEWDEEKGKYGLVAYERPLTEQELKEFDMKEWQVEKEMTASEILDEARMIQENYGFSPYEVEWDNEVFQDYLKEIDPEEHKRFNDLKGQFEKQSKKEKIDETFMERE